MMSEFKQFSSRNLKDQNINRKNIAYKTPKVKIFE